MKQIFLTMIALLTVMQGWAQMGILVTMETPAEEVELVLYWNGSGNVIANGVVCEVWNNPGIPVINGKVELVADGDVELFTLICDGNQLTKLDVSKSPKLTGLWCNSNQLTDLDVSKNIELTHLFCYVNQLTNLDLSKCPNIEHLDAANQQVEITIPHNATTFSNPIYYRNPTAIEKIVIDGVAYAEDAVVPIAENTISVSFTSTAIGDDAAPFGGTITINRSDI